MAEYTRIGVGMPMSVIALVVCTPFAFELGPAVQETAFSSAFALNRKISLLANRLQTSAKAIINRGHGIASGKTKDARFPGGTLSMQAPFFRELGMDLSKFFTGTLNLSVHPFSYRLGTPLHSFPQVKWTTCLPAENFSFYSCQVRLLDDIVPMDALVYWPHPSTKPEFHQDPYILEVLAPKIERIDYGKEMLISADPESLVFFLS